MLHSVKESVAVPVVDPQGSGCKSFSSPPTAIGSLIKSSNKLNTVKEYDISDVPVHADVELQGSGNKPKLVAAAMMKNKCHISRARSENMSITMAANDWCPPYGLTSIIGRRDEMEDTVAAIPCFYKGSSSSFSALHFFGVYDGHGGTQASVFCKERLHVALAKELRDLPPSRFDVGGRDYDEWAKVMRNCFIKMDIAVGGLCPSGNCFYDDNDDIYSTCCQDLVAPDNVGSTAVVAVVSLSQIVVGNCGDSRAVLCRGGKAVPFSNDHKANRVDEMDRIEAAGGQIINWNGYRVGGFLAMSRALGDRFLKQYVISEPEVICTERREEDEFLVLASDGLWDVVSNECVCEVAWKCLAGYKPRCFKGTNECGVAVAAALLTKLALARGSTDNISVVVVDLKRN